MKDKSDYMGTRASGVKKEELGKCPICGKKWKNDEHLNSIKGDNNGTIIRNIKFASKLLGENNIKEHSLYYKNKPPQAHHLISVSTIQIYGKICKTIGYNINCKENTVFLPYNKEIACHYRLPTHRGNHTKTYYSYVASMVCNIFTYYEYNICELELEEGRKKIKFQIIDDLNWLSKCILEDLQEFKITLHRDGLNFDKQNSIGCGNNGSPCKYERNHIKDEPNQKNLEVNNIK